MTPRCCSLLVLSAVLLAGGCDAFDYYPHHETPMDDADLRKTAGPDNYGGNNSAYPVGTPGTAGTTQPITAVSPPPVQVGAAAFGAGAALRGGTIGGKTAAVDTHLASVQ